MLQQNELYMQRCLQLAELGTGNVAPNPMVGAVLVYNDRIIGEGYHEKYGEAHAEVNCVESVSEEDKHLIKESCLYVSLEPCAHFGKTPPCADMIIKNKIPKVIIGCRDQFKEVNGRGIEKLKAANIIVETGILEKESTELNKRFLIFHEKKRPFIVLKWAQSSDKKIAANNNKRLLISNEFTNRLVHKWRSEEAAILVGTNTVFLDNPSLTNRLWSGKNPIRLILDKDLKLPENLKIFSNDTPTIVFNLYKNTIDSRTTLGNKIFFRQIKNGNIPEEICKACFELNIQSILVEGGTKLLQSFIDQKLYDEIRIITNQKMIIENGLNAPEFLPTKLFKQENVKNDKIEFFL